MPAGDVTPLVLRERQSRDRGWYTAMARLPYRAERAWLRQDPAPAASATLRKETPS